MSTLDIGATGERRAEAALRARGYRIVARNWKCRAGELDLVAYDRAGVLVFVEVRSRADAEHGRAAEMVTPRKRAKVSRVAAAYLAIVRPQFEDCRFDVVAITGDDIEVVADAWRLGRC